MRYIPYIPQNISELMDKLASIRLGAPSFKDGTGYFPQMSIETEFFALNEGLLAMRKKLGEEKYAALSALSDKMRALFEADPENTTGDTRTGRQIIHEMEDILTSKRRGSK